MKLGRKSDQTLASNPSVLPR